MYSDSSGFGEFRFLELYPGIREHGVLKVNMKDLHKSLSEKKDIVVSSLLFSHIFVDVVHIVCYVASVDYSYSLGLLFGVFILKSAISQHC